MPKRKVAVWRKIGRIFYGGEHVLFYDGLGIGRLIHDLPEDSCRLFLKEDTSGSVTGTFAVRGPVGGARKRTV